MPRPSRSTRPTIDYIAEPLRGMAVPIESLVPDPENVRRHRPDNLDAIRTSLQRYGQRLPFIVRRSDNVILAGNARTAVARELGWTHVAVLFVDDNAEASRAFAILDNRAAELGSWDDMALGTVLASLPRDLQLGVGFTEIDVMRLIEATGPPQAVVGVSDTQPIADASQGGTTMAPRVGVRQVVLVLTEDEHEKFHSAIETLRRRTGQPEAPLSAVVLRALQDAAGA